jgi:hypothetical protein
MKKTQWMCAVVCGLMLAITGCGSDDDNGGSAGTGGSSNGGDFCNTLCQDCGGGQAECEQACEFGFSEIPDGILESCPDELETLGNCFSANECSGDACDAELDAWSNCVISNFT